MNKQDGAALEPQFVAIDAQGKTVSDSGPATASAESDQPGSSRPRPERTPKWLWPNVFSLDAPIVALVWQDFVARLHGLSLPLAARIALFMAVWAVYIADRLIDVRGPAAPDESSRHRFYRRNRSRAMLWLALVLTAGGISAAAWLPLRLLVSGALVSAVVVAYLVAFPMRSASWLKKPSAAFVFAVGVLVVHWSWLAGVSFAALCLGNMLLVEDARARLPLALLAGGSVALAFLSPWQAAVAASATLLFGLQLASGKFSSDARSILADAALLTPLLFR